MRPSKYDWARLDPQMDALLAKGLRVTQVAQALEMRVQTIRDRLSYRRRAPRAGKKRVAPKLIDRRCLNCRAAFQVASPFLRLCPTCRAEC
ncbi:hypothetical protein HLH29_18610 [Gluconacetobacter tumulicola]|uniref:Uncharacterized protein n=2 Tax=Gluconacetobacter tumulicola TaxID=1017177 RepID=A0A7W4JH32_9PROT|nr:hypothetical protein [Gluconacetobacter tumulicola]